MSREHVIGPYSAYAIAVKYGYTGTEEQWVKEQETNRVASEQAAQQAEWARKDAQNAAKQAETAQQQTAEVRADALKKISAAKSDALDAVTAKQEHATAAVDTAKAGALDDVEVAKSAAVEAVSGTQATATQAVQTAQTTATSAVQAAQTVAVGAVEKACADVLASIPQDYQATVQKVEDLEAQKAEIDDSTVGLDAWSSKHIIDMLCPPLEETGTPVQCYPVAGYPLGVKAKWEPMRDGSGEPSPENIRPIKGRDSVTVERCGSNLLNPADYEAETKTINGITFTRMPTGEVKLAGTATETAIYTLIKSFAYNFLISSDGEYAVVGKNVISVHGLTSGVSLTRPRDNARMYIRVAYGATVNTTVYPQMEKGSTPTAYSPYTGQSSTLILPATIYGGTVDAVTGEGQETWKLLTLDGTENWNERTTVASADYTSYSINLPYRSQTGFCTHYRKLLYAAIKPNNPTGETGCYLEYSMVAIFNVPFENVGSWKSYLAAQYAAGTPVQIAYKLATPTTIPFTATGAQPIPALSGVNTVLTDADSVTVTGRADPIKRITDLEDAVASMT